MEGNTNITNCKYLLTALRRL